MSVRQIILLRHAHAEPPASNESDAARPLTPGGEQEAEAAAAWLKARGAEPDIVLYSPAVRSEETAKRVLAVIDGAKATQLDARIYEATPGTLIQILEEHAEADCVLLVGHNPGLENLVALLTDGTSDNGRGMPPCAIAWLHLNDDAPLEPGSASLRHFWWP